MYSLILNYSYIKSQCVIASNINTLADPESGLVLMKSLRSLTAPWCLRWSEQTSPFLNSAALA